MDAATSQTNIRVFGCSHHTAPVCLRERLAFAPPDIDTALHELRRDFPAVQAVLLSTCNRIELYSAATEDDAPSCRQWVDFLTRFHGMDPHLISAHFYTREGRAAVRHLFQVASSLDSIVVGEPQILAQVKDAYKAAERQQTTGAMIHGMFQAALRTARRVAHETTLHQHRVSVPRVAIADFARRVFDRFDDKRTLVIGAGSMAEETLKYLREQGAAHVTVVNRHVDRAESLARRWQGRAVPWEKLWKSLAAADLVISTTGAPTTLVSLSEFLCIEPLREGRLLLILDLAVPRDFDPAIGDRPGVRLFSVDDLHDACNRNRRARDGEIPAAMRIVEEETEKYLSELQHRAVAPTILRLQQGWQAPKEAELERLFHKVPHLSEQARHKIRHSFDRLLGKLMHPPLESLRAESFAGVPNDLMDAVDTLFQLKE